MSMTKHHTEWLSLLEISGPFLSLPVLNRTFPQGLETVAPALRQDLRAAYEEWLDNQGGVRANPALHRAWVEWVLTDLLAMDAEVLRGQQPVSQPLLAPMGAIACTLPEQGEILTPDYVVVNPGGAMGEVARLLVMVVPPDQELEKPLKGQRSPASPATRLMLLLHATGVRLGLVTNGEQWMIVDAPPGGATGYISWYAALWLEEPLTLQAFVTLFNAGRFFGVAPDVTIEALLTASAADQYEVTDQLGYQVRHAVELLVQALDLADRDSHGALLANVTNSELYEAAVVVMMRLVFLFTAEERKLLLLGDDLYDQHYALSTLQAQLRAQADQHGEEILAFRYDAWQRLLALCRAVHQGIHHDRLQLPAYGGDLFDPQRYPFLEGHSSKTPPQPSPDWGESHQLVDEPTVPPPTWGRLGGGSGLKISNRTVLHLLEALQFLQVKIGNERQARRLSFRALDVEQIGMVYEGLLDHTVRRASEPVIGLAGTRDREPEIALAQLTPARSRADLLAWLAEETGRSTSALSKALDAPPPDLYNAERLRVACDNDDALYQQVLPWHALIRNDDYGRPVVIPAGHRYVTSGTARRASGAHYTPRSLGEPLVQHTLEPLVYVGPAAGQPRDQWRLRTPDEILRLKICDMAMGSGALLVQSCRYLADRLLEAWEIENQKSKIENLSTDPAERLIFARRLIVQRCLYGVDKNPLAVEMAKLSLWLITMERNKPFSFVDHALRCGDSLIGVDLEQLKCWNLERSGQRQFGTIGLELDIQQMIKLRREIETMPVLDVRDQAVKRDKLARAQALANDLTSAADGLVSAYYNTLSKNEQSTLRSALLEVYQRGASVDPKWRPFANLDGLQPFHWPLEFPEVFLAAERSGFDGFVGNPPFIGGKRIREALGDQYRAILYDLYPGSQGGADLCAFFFLRAYRHLQTNGTLGLIATNTIAQGDTRLTGLAAIEATGGQIFYALNNIPWPGQAAVVVNIIHIGGNNFQPPYLLDGNIVDYISGHLDDRRVVGEPYKLVANSVKSHIGSYINGNGFILASDEAALLLSQNNANQKIISPYLNGQDLNSSPTQSSNRWVINFFDWPLERSFSEGWLDADEKTQKEWKRSGRVPYDYPNPVATDFENCLTIVRERVKPHRDTVERKVYRELWWQYAEKQKTLYESIASLKQVLTVAIVSKTVAFALIPANQVFAHKVVVFAYDDYEHFAILQSNFHYQWAWQYSSTLKQDLNYSPSDVFETFPFPGSNFSNLRAIGETYHEHRRQLMLARQEGLTATYNRFHNPAESAADIARLRALHVEMDHAVAAAYGWADLDLGHGFHATAQGTRYTISDAARREVLARLLALNHERYAEEVAAGLHGKTATSPAKARAKTGAATVAEASGQLNLFGAG